MDRSEPRDAGTDVTSANPSSALRRRVVCLVVWLASGGVGLPANTLDAQRTGPDTSLVGAEVRIIRRNEERARGVATGVWIPDSLMIRLGGGVPVTSSARRGNLIVLWSTIGRIDRRQGNHWLRGVLGALAASAAIGVYISVSQSGASDLDGPELWLLATGTSAVLTVPIGALIGSAYPRWRSVYQSGGRQR
jgi:hypothetical protein